MPSVLNLRISGSDVSDPAPVDMLGMPKGAPFEEFFEDFRRAEVAGAVVTADTAEALAER